jgi:hypothetical protein
VRRPIIKSDGLKMVIYDLVDVFNKAKSKGKVDSYKGIAYLNHLMEEKGIITDLEDDEECGFLRKGEETIALLFKTIPLMMAKPVHIAELSDHEFISTIWTVTSVLLSRRYAANVIASEAKQSSIANRINKGFIFVE